MLHTHICKDYFLNAIKANINYLKYRIKLVFT